MSYSCDHSDNDPLMQELRELRLADEAKYLGFKEDEEIVCFSSTDELKSKFDFYSKNNTIRNRIAMSGYKKIFKANNSLTDRLNQIINIIEEIR